MVWCCGERRSRHRRQRRHDHRPAAVFVRIWPVWPDTAERARGPNRCRRNDHQSGRGSHHRVRRRQGFGGRHRRERRQHQRVLRRRRGGWRALPIRRRSGHQPEHRHDHRRSWHPGGRNHHDHQLRQDRKQRRRRVRITGSRSAARPRSRTNWAERSPDSTSSRSRTAWSPLSTPATSTARRPPPRRPATALAAWVWM